MNRLKRSGLFEALREQNPDTRVLWDKGTDHDTVETQRYTAELRDGSLRAESPEGGLELHPIAVRWQGGKAAYRASKITYRKAHERKQARYRDAFGPGLHLEYDFDERIIKKDLVIDALPKIKGDLEVVFELEHDAPLEINSKQWNGKDTVIDGEIKTGRWTIERPVAVADGYVATTEDSAGTPGKQINPKLRLWRENGKTYIAKILPASWLALQTLPIRTDLTITLDSATIFETGQTSSVSIAALSSTKAIVAFSDGGDSQKGKVRALSISGTSISMGTVQTFRSSNTFEIKVSALSSTTFVVAYQCYGSGNMGHAVIGTLSGISITIATDGGTEFEAGDTREIGLAGLDSTHFVVAYQLYVGADDKRAKALCASVSGTTITFGTLETFVPESVDEISVGALDSTHCLIAYQDESDSYKGKVICGYRSGTSLSFGTEETFESGITSYTSIDGLGSSHFVIAFSDEDDSSKGKVIAGSVSGTTITITLDGATTFESGATYYISVSALDSTHFIIAFMDSSDSSKGKVIAGSVSGTTITITLDGATTFESGATKYHAIAGLGPSYFVIAYQDDSDSDKGKAIVGLDADVPTVTTQAATNVDHDSATGNGNITDDGRASITQYGVCWKKGADPVNIAGADGYTQEGAGTEGAFTSEMTELDNGSTYYYRAYATNSAGTSYGAAQSFYTDKLLSITDTGAGVDGAPSISVAIPVTDVGTGADGSPAIEGTIPVSDSGAGQDAVGSLEVSLTVTDTGACVDVAKGFRPVSVSDSGAGLDAIAAILAQIGVTDVGVGSDAGLLIINSFMVVDSGVGVETPTIKAYLPLLQDSGAGTDATPSIHVTLPLLADMGVGADALAIQAIFTLADSAAGVDSVSLEATIPIVDTGVGVDSIAGLLAQISVADSGVGQELIGILAQIGVTDTGSIQDWLSLVKAFISVADTGAGTEGDLTINNWIPKVAIDVQYPEEPDIEYNMD